MKINWINNLSFKQNPNTNNNNNGYLYYNGDTAVILTQQEVDCYNKAQKQIHKNTKVMALIGAIVTPIVSSFIMKDRNSLGAIAVAMTIAGAIGGSALGWLYSFIDKKCAGQYIPKQKLIWERAMARQKQANM